MLAFIVQVRDYREDCTMSEVYLSDKADRFCYALEDVGRPLGVKHAKTTCIPEGIYDVIITPSQRFGKDMLQVVNNPSLEVNRYGVKFTGVRIHGGNTVLDTEGCPLYAYNQESSNKISGKASDDLQVWVAKQIKAGKQVKLVITSK